MNLLWAVAQWSTGSSSSTATPSRLLDAAAWPLATSAADAYGVGQADAWPLATIAVTAWEED